MDVDDDNRSDSADVVPPEYRWLTIGTKVDYCPVIGRPPTRFGLAVRAAPQRLASGDWCVWLVGKPGAVHVLACKAPCRVALLTDASGLIRESLFTNSGGQITVYGARFLAALADDITRFTIGPHADNAGEICAASLVDTGNCKLCAVIGGALRGAAGGISE